MKTNEILQGNRILAEFMGHNSDLGASIRFMYSSSEPFPLSGNDANFESVESEVQMEVEEFGSTLEIETVSFHTSWDLLMPVVEKIESLGYDVFINGLYCRITDSGLSDFEIESSEVACKIEAVFSSCVEFAKWYKNQQK